MLNDGDLTTGRDAFENTHDKLFDKNSYIQLKQID